MRVNAEVSHCLARTRLPWLLWLKYIYIFNFLYHNYTYICICIFFMYINILCLFFNVLRPTLNLSWTVGSWTFYTTLTKNLFWRFAAYFQICAQFTGAFTLLPVYWLLCAFCFLPRCERLLLVWALEFFLSFLFCSLHTPQVCGIFKHNFTHFFV